MKLAFFGVGHWHAVMHAESARTSGAEILTAWDADVAKADRFADTYGAKVVSSIEEALQQEPDLAVVMGKPFEMADLARQMIAIKMPILIEKPVGVSGQVLKPIVDLAEETGAFVAVALAHSYSPLLEEFRKLKGDGRLGPVSHSHFRLINGPPQRYVDDGCEWVLDGAISGGGALRNLGIHGVNAFIDVVGNQKIDVVSASFGPRMHGTSVEDYAVVILRAEDGSIGMVEAGYTFASMIRGIFEWRVSTRNASLCDRGDVLEIVTLDDGCVREVQATPVARRYDAMMAKTIDRLRDGGEPAVTLARHWRAMDIIDRCYAYAGGEK